MLSMNEKRKEEGKKKGMLLMKEGRLSRKEEGKKEGRKEGNEGRAVTNEGKKEGYLGRLSRKVIKEGYQGRLSRKKRRKGERKEGRLCKIPLQKE